jgi:autophagy-related protein 101
MSNRKEQYLPELELPVAQVREALQCLLHTILFIRAPGLVAPVDVHLEDFDLTYTKIDTSLQAQEQEQMPPQQQEQQQQGQQPSPVLNYFYSNPNDAVNHNNAQHPNQLEQRVDDVIDSLLRSLVPIGPDLSQGGVMLNFFEKRASKQLFGFMKHEEKVVFESWILKVVVSSRDTITPRLSHQHHHSRSLGSSPGGAMMMMNNHRQHSMNATGHAQASATTSTIDSIERQRVRDTAEHMVRAAMLEVFDKAGDSIDHIPPVMYEFELALHNKPVGDDYRESIRSRVTNMPAIMKLNS